MPEFSRTYFSMSNGDPNVRGPWNSDAEFEYVENPHPAVDGGDGTASIELSEDDSVTLTMLKERTKSDLASDPMTGADLGSGLAQAADRELDPAR
jgi:Mn-containing catalase